MNGRIRLFALLSLLQFQATAQLGCTDSLAINYNPFAITNDGSCVYAPSYQFPTLWFNTLSTSENSGFEFIDDYSGVWVVVDNGNPPNLYKIDTASGNIIQTLHINNYPNTDWEAITQDSAYLYIGDFGNNAGDRTDLRILKILKSDFQGCTTSICTVNASAIEFEYEDQTNFISSGNTNFDCEAFISIGDSLYLFTKNHGNSETNVYRLSKQSGTTTAKKHVSYNVNGWITDASYQANMIYLVGYKSGHLNSFIYQLYDFQGTNFFGGNVRRIEIGNSTSKWQTEGITFSPFNSDEIYISCESKGAISAGVFKLDKNQFYGIGSIEHPPISNLKINYVSNGNFMITADKDFIVRALIDTDGRIIKGFDSFNFNTTHSIDTPLNYSGLIYIQVEWQSGIRSTEKLLILH